MKILKRRGAVGLLLSAFTFSGVPAHASADQLKHANRLFVKGDYDAALKAYEDALVDAPQSSVLHFNAGDAAYQTGDYIKAEKQFTEAGQSALPLLKATSHYNRGNALFRQQRWTDAIDAYKEALRVNPKDMDAKYNLGVAMKALTNPPKPKNQDQKQQQGSNKNQPKNGKPDNQKQNGSQSNAPTKPGEMSREDVERLLAAARSGEIKKSNQKFPKSETPPPDEDW